MQTSNVMTFHLVVVCTANVCRSPMGEALFRGQLQHMGALATVSSAGIIDVELPVDPEAVHAMAEMGLDISRHRPRKITRQLLANEQPDLILTVSRKELRHVVSLDRTYWPRTFTLKEAVRRSSEHPGVGFPSLTEWVAFLGSERRAADMLHDDPDDDIPDPYGSGTSVVRSTARTLNSLISSLLEFAPFSQP